MDPCSLTQQYFSRLNVLIFTFTYIICTCRTKLKQTEVDCEVLKKCCETLTEENKRLQKELQELKSMKTTPAGPLYVQLPVASLTICPSCERVSGGNSNNEPSPNTALLIGSKVHPHFYKTNYPFTQSSAAC